MFIGSLIPNSDFSQLTRVPDMLEHYELHQQEVMNLNIEISFWEFLKIHFITPDGHEHEGNDDHQNCPFQSFCSSITFALTTANFSFSEKQAPASQGKLSYLNAFYLNGFVSTEIQPPTIS